MAGRNRWDDDEDDFGGRGRRVRRRRKDGSRGPLLIILAIAAPLLLVGGGLLIWAGLSGRGQDALARNRERLVGKWTALVQQRHVTYDFRADGTVVLTTSGGAGRSEPSMGTWKAVSAKGDAILVHAESAGAKVDMNIEFVSNDRFRYTTPNGVVVDVSRVR